MIRVYRWGVLCHVGSLRNLEHFKTGWQYKQSHVDTKDHYLDDFIFAGHIASVCRDTMSTINSVCHELGEYLPNIAEDFRFGNRHY